MFDSFALHLMDDLSLFKNVESFGLRPSLFVRRPTSFQNKYSRWLLSNLEGTLLNQGMLSVIPSSTDKERSQKIDDRGVRWDANMSDSFQSLGHCLLPCSIKKQPQVSSSAKCDYDLMAILECLHLAWTPFVEANIKAMVAIFPADPLELENWFNRMCNTDHILNGMHEKGFTNKQFCNVVQVGWQCWQGNDCWRFTYQGIVVITDSKLEVGITMWQKYQHSYMMLRREWYKCMRGPQPQL